MKTLSCGVTASCLFLVLLALVSCSVSAPPAPEKTDPAYILKLVPYGKDESLITYFTLGDVHTNQVAASGSLRVQVYTTTGLSIAMGDAPPTPSMGLRNILYDATLDVASTNFHWESTGTLLTVDDLSCRFIIPYDRFSKPVSKGKTVTVEIHFLPEGSDKPLKASRKVAIY